MLGLSVDENPLKLQLLLELLEVRQLHIRAGWAEKSNSWWINERVNLFGGDLGEEEGVFRQVDETDIMAELNGSEC